MTKNKSFTLMEILVYIGVLSVIIVAISSFFLWAIRSNTKTRVTRETLDNSRRSMEIIIYEIKEAQSVYTPTSSSSQLSLETTHYLPQGEKISYIDFYLCGTQLCLKKESQSPIALTSERVEVKNLFFTQVATTSTLPSIRVSLTIDYKNPSNLPEYQASVNLSSTASLRNY
ncbi:hypothetical protein AMJ50_00720 [Parcubacteria bacterium DG_74_3]|nr:MAG: hypothetical protein AMJ50_00720 [Parcubacteria bacterium DG_74_3]